MRKTMSLAIVMLSSSVALAGGHGNDPHPQQQSQLQPATHGAKKVDLVISTLGKNADIHGELKTKSIVVYGTVNGNISVLERAELKSTSQLTGDLKAMRIVIEEGAIFVGKSEVTPKADRAGISATF